MASRPCSAFARGRNSRACPSSRSRPRPCPMTSRSAWPRAPTTTSRSPSTSTSSCRSSASGCRNRAMAAPIAEIEVRLLLEAIYERYHYDFREYAMASLKRRLSQACDQFDCRTITALQERVLHDPKVFSGLLQYLTVQVSDMFRDPEYFRVLRTQVLPVLATYPSIKIWVAGCSMGEEAYSIAILLKEAALLERSIIYATDINAESLRAASLGVYPLSRLRGFTENHRRSGATHSLSEHYHASGESA